jgi:hypothetical protein
VVEAGYFLYKQGLTVVNETHSDITQSKLSPECFLKTGERKLLTKKMARPRG